MLDPMFSFIDPIVDPVVELSEDTSCFVILVEIFFDILEKAGIDRKTRLPKGEKIEVPIDVVLSLLRPEELEKLKRYLASYEEAPDS